MRDETRRGEHRRNSRLEDLLSDLGGDLEAAAQRIPAHRDQPRHPAVFVVGSPRSGTTLTYQWLAATGVFTYPTNFVSRFPTAPWIGERIQLMLTDPDYDFRGELTRGIPADPASFESRLGKTRGLTAPNEFWYWWRRFLPERDTHQLSEDDLAAVDTRRMLRELAAWEAVADKPLAMKGLILNWNLPWLARVLPNAVFVHIRRDPFFTMQSLLSARRDYFGDEGQWYSFRPPEYPWLQAMPPARQVAGQVWHTERAVTAGLSVLPQGRRLTVDYEDLCRDPGAIYGSLIERLADRGHAVTQRYAGPASFPVSRQVRVTKEEAAELKEAWEAVVSRERTSV